mmetsp:Transcript_32851/g.77541  ORF Transcript_32851/g.77541 Transcript_32851/m.77541 type:complete len:246 (+) Transcript_32851:135-872(+)
MVSQRTIHMCTGSPLPFTDAVYGMDSVLSSETVELVPAIAVASLLYLLGAQDFFLGVHKGYCRVQHARPDTKVAVSGRRERSDKGRHARCYDPQNHESGGTIQSQHWIKADVALCQPEERQQSVHDGTKAQDQCVGSDSHVRAVFPLTGGDAHRQLDQDNDGRHREIVHAIVDFFRCFENTIDGNPRISNGKKQHCPKSKVTVASLPKYVATTRSTCNREKAPCNNGPGEQEQTDPPTKFLEEQF